MLRTKFSTSNFKVIESYKFAAIIMIRILVVSIVLISVAIFACSSNENQQKTKKDNQAYIWPALTGIEKTRLSDTILFTYSKYLLPSFSGGILVAKKGNIIFEDYQGMYDNITGQKIDANSAIHLASVSKTFTAAAILKLMEQNKLSLEDSLSTYFPSLPYKGITIKMLLTHRSGLPNYVYFMDGNKTIVSYRKNKRGRKIRVVKTVKDPNAFQGIATNNDVLNFMVAQKPGIQAYPDRRFQYCNTNYVLLALILEKITGQSFPAYLKKEIFEPYGLKNSFVFSITDTARYVPSYGYRNSIYKLEQLDCVYGDKNIYSTPRDILQWDKVLYEGKFLSEATLQLAFQPYSFERSGTHNYGLGFRLLINPSEKIVYHNGWWHGNNTVFTRLIKDSSTVIILGNRFNKNIYAYGRRLPALLHQQSDSTNFED